MKKENLVFYPQCVSHELTDLRFTPHIDIPGTDLAIAANYNGTLVDNVKASELGLTPAEVMGKAADNKPHYKVDLLSNMIGVPPEPGPQLYVLTTKDGRLGASILDSREELVKAKMEIGENFYILPSSIHECIAVPDSIMAGSSPEEMQKMVADINQQEVSPTEQLSNSVYHFSGRNLTSVAGPAKDYVQKLSKELLQIKHSESVPEGKGIHIRKGR